VTSVRPFCDGFTEFTTTQATGLNLNAIAYVIVGCVGGVAF